MTKTRKFLKHNTKKNISRKNKTQKIQSFVLGAKKEINSIKRFLNRYKTKRLKRKKDKKRLKREKSLKQQHKKQREAAQLESAAQLEEAAREAERASLAQSRKKHSLVCNEGESKCKAKLILPVNHTVSLVNHEARLQQLMQRTKAKGLPCSEGGGQSDCVVPALGINLDLGNNLDLEGAFNAPARESLARESLARESLARESLSREAPRREELARETSARLEEIIKLLNAAKSKVKRFREFKFDFNPALLEAAKLEVKGLEKLRSATTKQLAELRFANARHIYSVRPSNARPSNARPSNARPRRVIERENILAAIEYIVNEDEIEKKEKAELYEQKTSLEEALKNNPTRKEHIRLSEELEIVNRRMDGRTCEERPSCGQTFSEMRAKPITERTLSGLMRWGSVFEEQPCEMPSAKAASAKAPSAKAPSAKAASCAAGLCAEEPSAEEPSAKAPPATGRSVRFINNATFRPSKEPTKSLLAQGSFKAAFINTRNNGFVHLEGLPDNRDKPFLKVKQRDDFKLSKLLSFVCPDYFPNVFPTCETRGQFFFKKVGCMPIDKKNLSGELLNRMIDVTIELIDNYGIFTFDLKPANMGLLNRRPVLLDVGADCSHLIRPDCDTTDYKSFMLLVLLVYCYNFRLSAELTLDQLRAFAK